ncbi:uncharacterized protein LOC120768987 [Bactrocera tryoni]|uniref:uncharacterized protein LOC120768987 n=1 Tax=Bactrocera tryoni TaxID=59916 RepID=UPI001A961F48|nr:uncharacterized protein LOC120768987 [Bactrocera tryoni]
MDAEMPIVPTPTVRSAVTVPRPRATPVAAPRTTIAAAPPRKTQSAPRSNPQAIAPEQPQRQCTLCRRRHRLPHCRIFKGMTPLQRQQIAQAHGHCLNYLAPTHLHPNARPGTSARYACGTITRCFTAPPNPTSGVIMPLAVVLPAVGPRDRNREGRHYHWGTHTSIFTSRASTFTH